MTPSWSAGPTGKPSAAAAAMATASSCFALGTSIRVWAVQVWPEFR